MRKNFSLKGSKMIHDIFSLFPNKFIIGLLKKVFFSVQWNMKYGPLSLEEIR